MELTLTPNRLGVISRHDYLYVVPSKSNINDPSHSPSANNPFKECNLRDISRALGLPTISSLLLTRQARRLRGLFHMSEMLSAEGGVAYSKASTDKSTTISLNYSQASH